VLEPFLEM